jgi:hypothetical protein
MAQARNELITVPVSSLDVVVTHNGTRVTDVQTYAAEETITNYKRNTNETLFVASFMAELPPVGYSVYTLTVGAATPFPTKKVSTNSIKKVSTSTPTPPPTIPSTFSGKAFSIENQYVMVNFSANGLMSGLTNKANGLAISLHQSFCYYISSEGNQASGQKSGAYIFRPNSTACYPVQMAADNGGASIELVVRGDVVNEVRQRFSPWLTQTVRLSKEARFVELVHTIGAIPFVSTTANKTLEQCVAWRQTGNCDPNGAREPTHDQPCNATIPLSASGYCECEDGTVRGSVWCRHTPFKCAAICARASIAVASVAAASKRATNAAAAAATSASSRR